MDIQVVFVTVNRRGQPQRDQLRVAGPSISIGRGTQCQIHLPDPRIALQHARITVSEDGATLEAASGRVQVNGHEVAGAQLAVGDRIEVGPYLLEVESPPAGLPLALSVTLAVPLPALAGGGRRFTLRPPRVSKRRLSYIAFIGTLLVCLLVPIAPELLGYPQTPAATMEPNRIAAEPNRIGAEPSRIEHVVRTTSARLLQTWNPGPVSRAHQPVGADCLACHAFPFVQVRDVSCIACHKTIREHVPAAELTGKQGQAFRDTRCAECHRDHKGMQMAPYAQEQCADCHRDVKGVAADAKSGKATDFRTEHPEFRLSLLDADKPDAIRRVRQSKPPSPDMVERSNLKFNHALHLDPGGVRDPEGKRDAAGVRDAQGRRTVLRCKDCHEPNEGGRLMAPVLMELHCQRCHSLAFEPKVTKRQVVHGDEEAIATMLREFYARLVLGDVPPDVNPPPDLPRMRPGAVVTYQQRQQALKIADEKAKLVLRELYETRKVCSTCHGVTRKADGTGWDVAPVRVAEIWMPQALFSHAKHATEKCSKCHDVAQSKDSKHIAMPDIAICRECHVGARAVAGKVTSDCATCHKFHAGRDYWHGVLQAQMLPRGTK
ncbi:MAG: cytochrome c3 family protein [Betaproteobacteria bacterium]|nr:cytochrome c3 family protein [Betaproteobacteria bacterium]